MSKRKIGSAPFSVDPKVIVKESRLNVLTGNWFKGFELLSKSLIGIDYEYASAILSGSGTLELVNGQAVCDQATDSEYKQTVQEQTDMLALFYIEDGICYEPICHVLGLTPADRQYALESDDLKASCTHKPSHSDITDKRMEFYVSSEFHHSVKKVQDSKNGSFVGVWLTPSKYQIPPWLESVGNNKSFIDKLVSGSTKSNLIKPDDLKLRRSTWFDKCELNINSVSLPDVVTPNAIEEHVKAPMHLEVAKKVWDANGDEFVILSGFKVALRPLLSWGSYVCKRELTNEHWTPISPKHWKTMHDNNTHTDWVVSTGIDPEDFYSKHEDLNGAAYKYVLERSRNVREKSTENSFKLIPLVVYRESDLSGVIQHMSTPEEQIISNIIAIPDCSIKWRGVAVEIGKRGGVIIAKAGGELSHLIIESEDIGATVYLSDELDTLTQNYDSVVVNYASKTISVTSKNANQV